MKIKRVRFPVGVVYHRIAPILYNARLDQYVTRVNRKYRAVTRQDFSYVGRILKRNGIFKFKHRIPSILAIRRMENK